jgi:tetratricopeptide (TPR) repeat protein
LKILAQEDTSARHSIALLNVLGFFHNRGISEDIFLRAWKYGEEVSTKPQNRHWSSDRLDLWHVAQSRMFNILGSPEEKKRLFRRCRAHLLKLSLVSMDSTGSFIHLHSLVHSWIKERVQHTIEAWTAAASILALSTQNRTSWQVFTPSLSKHMEACLTLRQHHGAPASSSLGIYTIRYIFAWQMHQARNLGTLGVCEYLVQDLSCSGNCVDLLVYAQHQLGIVYKNSGQVPRAIKTLQYVVKALAREQITENDSIRLAAQHELAGAYLANGQVLQAIKILEHVSDVRAQRGDDDDPDGLASLHQLAVAYTTDGQSRKAIEILERVVQAQVKLPDGHPNRLNSQHELARAYLANRKISRATELLEGVVKVVGKLAEDHPDRQSFQSLLGSAYLADK